MAYLVRRAAISNQAITLDLLAYSPDNDMKLQTKSTFGNFAIEAETDVTQEQLIILGSKGVLQELQRSPASAAEKALAGYDKRPSGFKRDSIPFSEGAAETLTSELEKPIEIADGVSISCSVVVTEYVPSVADVKMTDERNAYARHGKAGDLPAFAAKVAYEGQLGDGTKENAPVEFLRAIKRFTDDWLRNQA